MGLGGHLKAFFDTRFDTGVAGDFLDKQAHKRLPPHTGWLHVFGSLSLLLFVSKTITGILLLVYYRPTPEEAHQSIQYITAEVNFGWLYRQVHAWGATLMRFPFRSKACDFMYTYLPSLDRMSGCATGMCFPFMIVCRFLSVPGILSSMTFSAISRPVSGSMSSIRNPPSTNMLRPATQ